MVVRVIKDSKVQNGCPYPRNEQQGQKDQSSDLLQFVRGIQSLVSRRIVLCLSSNKQILNEIKIEGIAKPLFLRFHPIMHHVSSKFHRAPDDRGPAPRKLNSEANYFIQTSIIWNKILEKEYR